MPNAVCEEKLCIIDFPVLKAHGTAGATIAVKNWIGVLTTAYSSQRYGGWNTMHSDYFFGTYALVARVMEVCYPRLSIIDAAWTSGVGPNNLNYLHNTNMLAASTDPVVADWYTSKFILTPVANDPGETDPDLPGSSFAACLTNWCNYLAGVAGLPCTKDSAQMSVYNRDVLPGTGIEKKDLANDNKNSLQVYPNPVNGTVTISFKILDPGQMTLRLVDLNDRIVKVISEGELSEGKYKLKFNSDFLLPGVYQIVLQNDNLYLSKKVIKEGL
ncbi:MAG: DUF362 domain-containing protein [Bacteroidetes bacterium]|nr:DUF362 domain-containing protein [Bacteroidota bacterium]